MSKKDNEILIVHSTVKYWCHMNPDPYHYEGSMLDHNSTYLFFNNAFLMRKEKA